MQIHKAGHYFTFIWKQILTCFSISTVLSYFHRSHQSQTKTALLSLFICFFSGPGAQSWQKPPGARRCACSPFPRAARFQITFTHICFCAVSLSRFSAVAGSSWHNRNHNDGWAEFWGELWKERGIPFMRSDRNQSVLEWVRRAKNLRLSTSDHNRANFSFLTQTSAASDLHWNCHKTQKMLMYISGVGFLI